MIELNGIYKLKHIKDLGHNDGADFKVIAIEGEYVACKQINGDRAGEHFYFMKEFFIDPEKPDDIYSDIIRIKK